MNEQTKRDLARAFALPEEEWRESHRRIVRHIEWLEATLESRTNRLHLFQKAAADEWLSEHLHND